MSTGSGRIELLESVTEAQRDHRIIFEDSPQAVIWWRTVVDLVFLGMNIVLDLRVGADILTIHTRAGARTTGQIQRSFWRAPENHSGLEADAEAPSASAKQVSKSNQEHGRDWILAKVYLSRARDRISGIADVIIPTERKRSATGYQRTSGRPITVVDQEAGTYVEAMA